MALEGSCNDTEKLHLDFQLDGKLDEPATIEVMSGLSTAVVDANSKGAYFVSEDNVQGDGPFDTHYHINVMANGQQLPGDWDVILHVTNNPATTGNPQFGSPEPK